VEAGFPDLPVIPTVIEPEPVLAGRGGLVVAAAKIGGTAFGDPPLRKANPSKGGDAKLPV